MSKKSSSSTICDSIVINLKKRKVSGLTKDLKSLNADDSASSNNSESFCRILRHISSYLDVTSEAIEGDAIFDGVKFSVGCLMKNANWSTAEKTNLSQFHQSLYYVLKSYLKLKLYSHAIEIAKIFSDHLKSLKNPDELFHIFHNIYVLFWNEAVALEKTTGDYNTGLLLRCESIVLTAAFPGQLQHILKRVAIVISQYFSSSNSTCTHKLFQDCFQRICTKLFDCLLCSEYCAMQFYFQHFCKWITLFGAAHYGDMINFLLLTLKQFESNCLPKCSCHMTSQVLRTCIDISRFCLSTFSLKTNISICDKTVNTWMEVLNSALSVPDVVDSVTSVSVLFSWIYTAAFCEDLAGTTNILKMNFSACSTICDIFLKACNARDDDIVVSIGKHIPMICYLLRGIAALIKEENCNEECFKWIPAALQYANKLNQLLSSHAFQKNVSPNLLYNSVASVINVGRLLMQKNLCEEAIPFLEFGVTNFEGLEIDTWPNYEFLINCYLSTKCFDKGLCEIAKAMLIHEKRSQEAFQLWRKIKRRASEAEVLHLRKKTVIDSLREAGIYLSNEKQLHLLQEELYTCKSDRRQNCSEEIRSVILQLFSCTTDDLTRADVLVEMSQLPQPINELRFVNKSSSLDMCEDAVDILLKSLKKEENDIVKLKLSSAYFWLYCHRRIECESLVMEEMSKCDSATKGPIESVSSNEGNEDDSENYDIKPSFARVTFDTEAELLKILEKAVALWKEISENSDCSWSCLREQVEYMNLMKIMQVTAEIFCTASQDMKELNVLCILRDVAFETENETYQLTTIASIVILLVRLGHLSLAERVLTHAESAFPKDSQKIDDSCFKIAKLKLLFAKCTYLLQVEKFSEGYQLLETIVQNPVLEKKTTACRILKMELKILHAKYLNTAFQTLSSTDKLPCNRPIVKMATCVQQCLRYIKEEHLAKKQSLLDTEEWRNKVAHVLLTSSLMMGDFSLEIGAPRKARFYLTEALTFANKLIHPYWCGKILIALSNLDLICNEIGACEAKMNAIDYMLKSFGQVHSFKLTPKLNCDSPKNNCSSGSFDDSENSFLVTKSQISRSGEIRLKFKEEYKNADFTSPLTHLRRNAIKTEIGPHAEHCTCHSCSVYSLGLLRFETEFLKCLCIGAKGFPIQSVQNLSLIAREQHLLDKLANIKNVWLSFPKNKSFEVCGRILPILELSLIIEILFHKTLILCSTSDFDRAKISAAAGMKMLCSVATLPHKLYPKLYSYIAYANAVVTMRMSSMTSTFFSEISVLTSDVENLTQRVRNLEISTNTPQRSIPEIQLDDCAMKITLCKAPKKKNIVPSAVKKAISDLSSAEQTETFNFSGSEAEDDAFVSPAENQANPTEKTQRRKSVSLKIRSRRLSLKTHGETTVFAQSKRRISRGSITKSTEKPKKYKFFKSKSSQSPVCSLDSGNVWSATIKPDLKMAFEFTGSTPNRRTRNNKTSRPAREPAKGKKQGTRGKAVDSETKAKPKRQKKKCFENLVSSPVIMSPVEKTRNMTLFTSNGSSDLDQGNSVKNKSSFSVSEGKRISPILKCNISEVSSVMQDESYHLNTTKTSKLNNCNISSSDIENLTVELESAIWALRNNPICPLYSCLCKALAIVNLLQASKNVECDEDAKYTAAYLLNESFAVALRHQAITGLTASNFESPSTQKKFEAVDFLQWDEHTSLPDRMKIMIERLPDNFVVVQIAEMNEDFCCDIKNNFVPKLILTRYHKGSPPCIFGLDSSGMFSSNVLDEFDDILIQNRVTMSNKKPSVWWSHRRNLDTRIKTLTETMEKIWLMGLKCLFLGLPVNSERSKQIDVAAEHLCKRFNCFSNRNTVKLLLDSAPCLNESELSCMVTKLWNVNSDSQTHGELLQSVRNLSEKFVSTKRHPVVLILDKDVQRLPWENMPLLRSTQVTRVPSLNLLNSLLLSYPSHHINSKDTFFVLNPTNDIPSTQKVFEKQFAMCESWKGIIGRLPSVEEFKRAFTDYELFLYFGHGSGRRFLGSERLEGDTCKAAVVVMGCSSGSLKKWGPTFEPIGDVLQYILGGCPCVVGTLWDVTDKDIDRLSDEFLRTWLPIYGKTGNQPEFNISEALSRSKNVCKLPYLTGAACVVYGIPVVAEPL